MYCNYRFIVGKYNLTIMNVTDKDGGEYTCLANTTLDSVSAKAVLTVVGKISLNVELKQKQICYLILVLSYSDIAVLEYTKSKNIF